MRVTELDVVATAAIREAENGAEFIREVRSDLRRAGEGAVGRARKRGSPRSASSRASSIPTASPAISAAAAWS